jgi:hypothetical protein
MPYTIKKEKCKKSDGGSGSHRLRYTDKSGKKHSSCHSSKKSAQGSIAAIEMRREEDEMSVREEVMSEILLRESIRVILSEAGNLSAREMQNRAKRWDIFLQKMKEKSPFFDLEDNQFVIPVAGNKALVSALKTQDPDAYNAAFQSGITTIPPGSISTPSNLKKTPEFGGLASGARLAKEQGQIDQIQAALDLVSPVNVFVGNKKAKNVVAVQKVEGTPKADAVLVDEAGKKVAAISLKDADTPTQMQQWGGIDNYADHPEVIDFVNDLKAVHANSPTGRIETAYFRKLNDPELARKICYGNGTSFENNCDMIIASQAPIQISSSGKITATNIFYAPEIPSGEWAPTFWATWRTGRGKNLGLTDIRVGVYPLAWGSTRANEPLPSSKKSARTTRSSKTSR